MVDEYVTVIISTVHPRLSERSVNVMPVKWLDK